MRAASVTMLRSRGARPGRFHTSPSRRSCVYFSSAGATIRTSLNVSIGGTPFDLVLAVAVLEATEVASEPEMGPPEFAWEQAAARSETNMTVTASRFISVLPSGAFNVPCSRRPRGADDRLHILRPGCRARARQRRSPPAVRGVRLVHPSRVRPKLSDYRLLAT